MRIFISHSSQNAETARGICARLEEDGHSCFIAPRDIRPGREYAEEIIDGIRGADALLLLLTEQSNQSPHVLREVERAGSSRIPVIVYRMEEVALTKSLEYFLMTNQWIDGVGDTDYRRVSEAFRSRPDTGKGCAAKSRPGQASGHTGERDIGSAAKGQPGQAAQGRGRKGSWKRAVSALVLLLTVSGIVFALSKAGSRNTVTDQESRGVSGGTLTEEHGGQAAGNVMQGAGSDGQAAGNVMQGAGSDGQAAGNGPQAAENVDLSLGASVELGTYGGEPILWRVLHIPEDGEQLILISDKILTMKAFDAAESGRYNYDDNQDYWAATIEDYDLEAYVRGSNLWVSSNIRAWLNSDRENVTYEGQAPTAAAMSEKKNGYSNEAGFLHGFTREERAVLREADLLTIGNCVIDANDINTKDKVFLLSEWLELDWFAEVDISVYAIPTEYAVEQDQTGWYEGYSLSLGVEEYPWLLRDPADGSTSRCKAVGNGSGYQEGDGPCEILDQIEAGVEGFGIRPAICVDRQALAELIAAR